FAPSAMPLRFVPIHAGAFKMGSDSGDPDERPVHEVRITRAFAIQNTEMTQRQWTALMGSNTSHFSDCGDCPVENVSWDDIQKVIRILNARKDGYVYRLPTEAEWEYAARAGAADESHTIADDNVGWFSANSGGRTHPVATKLPNAWGLYDMHGNVWEWV